jgi:hypothetical protein
MRGNQRGACRAPGANPNGVDALSVGRAKASTTPPVENFRSRARQLTPSAVWKSMSAEGPFGQAKRLFVGEPIPSHLAHHERLSRFTGSPAASLRFRRTSSSSACS